MSEVTHTHNISVADAVEALEKRMLAEPQVSCEVTHSFGPGLYMRQLTVPAGTFLVGHHQNFEHVNLFIKGSVTVLKDDGTTERLTAPMNFVGKPGRKVGLVHEDMVWVNVYATNETDVEKLESMFLTKSETFTAEFAAQKARLLDTGMDRADFLLMLKEAGVTEETARAQSENLEDMIAMPFGNYKIKVGKSAIEGQGLFATGDIEAHEIIGPARLGDKRTIAGRFTNHSANPNAHMIESPNGNIFLQALRPIAGCRGGFDGEEITTDYRVSRALVYQIHQIISGGS